ncbi:hypothetical protein HZ326_21672 [Fusarium oxysporum f. sp. albedinis]|nr:hypothetical protein HZ326_21672 [Fusarium oxysporum f. sp. albedinis]
MQGEQGCDPRNEVPLLVNWCQGSIMIGLRVQHHYRRPSNPSCPAKLKIYSHAWLMRVAFCSSRRVKHDPICASTSALQQISWSFRYRYLMWGRPDGGRSR